MFIVDSKSEMSTTRAPTLHTERLELRPVELADHRAVQQKFPKWEIVKLLAAGVPWPYPSDGALSFIRDSTLPAVERGEEWAWTIRRSAEPAQLIGCISLFAKEGENRGYWLDPGWQGQGLMLEACQATCGFWFDQLGQSVLREYKAVENEASCRLSERQHMRVIWRGERNFVAGRLPAETWELTDDEWRRAQV
jgi:ribosomal-protein-alanine N-acetyltransferase